MWGNRERRWLSSTRASWARVPSLFFKFQMPTLGATLEQKNGVLELTKLEYHKKWYFPIYFPNSVSGPNISKINANGPFCLCIRSILCFTTTFSLWHSHKNWKKQKIRKNMLKKVKLVNFYRFSFEPANDIIFLQTTNNLSHL